MAREDQRAADNRQGLEQAQGDGRNEKGSAWYGGERENEFGGEPRFRAEGRAHGSHFGGEPEALGTEERNTSAWLGERRRKFMEKIERWRRERAARAAEGGPDGAPAESAPATGRDAEK